MRTALLQKLDEIEAEMRRIGFWIPVPPEWEVRVAKGDYNSYLDAPTFENWLQTVFLPKARLAAETGDLPSESQVGTMAMRQYDYHSFVPEAQDLLKMLFAFDDLVRVYHKGAGKH